MLCRFFKTKPSWSVCVITCMSQGCFAPTFTQALPGELQSSEAFQYNCWPLVILTKLTTFVQLFHLLFVLLVHWIVISRNMAFIVLHWLLVGAFVSEDCCWLGCYDAGRSLSLLQPWWIRPATVKRTFGKQQLVFRAQGKQMLVWLMWMMDESISDGWLFEFVCINAGNMGIYDWHIETVSPSAGDTILSTLLWLFLILLWMTQQVMHSNDFIDMLRNI